MIRKLSDTDFQTIFEIVNDAAVAYKGKIPEDCYKTPYMPQEELREEIEAGVQFYGIHRKRRLSRSYGNSNRRRCYPNPPCLHPHQSPTARPRRTTTQSPAWIGENTSDSSRHMGSGVLGNPILPKTRLCFALKERN